MMQKIIPFLWFDGQAEEAMNFYTTIFDDGEIINVRRYPDGPLDGPMQDMEGKVLTGVFSLGGQRFMALDGGPYFKLTPAVSFFVNCDTEDEIDALWGSLAEGGSVLMPFQPYPFSPKFGWVEDRYGVSWQLSLGSGRQKISPFLLFVGSQHGQAEAALNLYTALFPDSQINHLLGYDDGETVQLAAFTLNGQGFMASDGGLDHEFTFTEAVSLYVHCESQEEIDRLWMHLSAVPEAEQCGWLKDRFGLSWQIVPDALSAMLDGSDPHKAKNVMDALLQMKKIDISALERAWAIGAENV